MHTLGGIGDTPLCHTYLQATRNILRVSEQVNDMLADWRELNFVEISQMSVFLAQQDADPENDLVKEGKNTILCSKFHLHPSFHSCFRDGTALCKAVTSRGLL